MPLGHRNAPACGAEKRVGRLGGVTEVQTSAMGSREGEQDMVRRHSRRGQLVGLALFTHLRSKPGSVKEAKETQVSVFKAS